MQATTHFLANAEPGKGKTAQKVASEVPASVYQIRPSRILAAHKEWTDQVLEEEAKQLHQRGSAGYLDQLPNPVQCEIRQKLASEVAARHQILVSEVIRSQAAFTGTGHSLRDKMTRIWGPQRQPPATSEQQSAPFLQGVSFQVSLSYLTPFSLRAVI